MPAYGHRHSGGSMNVRKSTFRLFTIGAIVAAAAVCSSTAAFAGVGVSTTGAFLSCNTYNDGNGSGHADCTLTDTAADSHSVYAVMQADGYRSVRYNNNKGGYGTSRSFTYSFVTDTPQWDFYYKVCRDIQFGFDNCSGWVHIVA
jgi:hypothetical protein